MIAITSTDNLSIDFRIQRNGIGRLLLVIILMLTITACKSPSPATGQWTPPYLKLHLSAGKAQVQWPGDSEWTTLESEADIAVKDTGRIIADEVEGAQFSTGDSSILELASRAVIEVQNPRTLPRLQVTLRAGTILFTAHELSYEFFTPICSVLFLSIPSQVEIEVNGETTHLAVKEGAVTCALEEETLTLSTCREVFVSPGEDPEVTEFCISSTATPLPTVTRSPTPTPWWLNSTAIPSPTSTPTPTVTATPTLVPTPVPTDTPTPLPTSPPRPEPTEPPPTSPPPTSPPPTNPPPTNPPPTSPPPTEQPTRPPPTAPPPPTEEPRPTSAPGS